MRGHEEIAAARRRGAGPSMVWIDCDGYNEGVARLRALGCWLADWIELRPEDNPLRLDLRCVIGLLVLVSGLDERRVAAVARACEAAGARQVIASWHKVHHAAGDPLATVERLTTTNEELAEWPQ
jgi:hypothetical protein